SVDGVTGEGAQHDGVTISVSFGDLASANAATRASPVLDHKLLTEGGGKVLSHNSTDNVGCATWSVGNDKANWLIGVVSACLCDGAQARCQADGSYGCNEGAAWW